MDKYLRWKASEYDEDVIIFSEVQIVRDVTDAGPKKGQRFPKVTWSKLSDSVIFHLHSGRCHIVRFDGDKAPAWMGEYDRPPIISAE